MALFAIGDLHLSFQSDKSMDLWGGVWVGHEQQILDNFSREIGSRDTLILAGDHTWGRTLQDCSEDFRFIESLPGRKILTRGNHDMFWPAGRTRTLNEAFKGRLEFIQSDVYAVYKDYALVSAKGYCFEGRGSLTHAEKLVAREAQRLRKGFEKASEDGYRKFIMILHYPPTNIYETMNQQDSVFTRMAEEYHVSHVIYAHCHGDARFHDSYRGMRHGIPYSLVSGDCLKWHAERILD